MNIVDFYPELSKEEAYSKYKKEYCRQYRLSHKAWDNERKRIYHQNTPGAKVKQAARKAVYNAIKRGTLIPQPCASCGKESDHAHHEDYSKQLEVVWYCHECHVMRHRNIRHRNLVIQGKTG